MSLITDENRRVDALIRESRQPLDADIVTPADLVELRVLWGRTEPIPILLEHRSQGVDRSWAGLDIRTLLKGEESAGVFSAHSIELAQGAGIPVHYFDDTHTFVLVEDGEVELAVGATVDQVGRYSLGYVPPKTRQTFRNRSDSAVTLTVVHSPAGAERAFAAAHDLWQETGATDDAAYVGTLSRFGFRFDDDVLANDETTNAKVPELAFELTGPGDLERLREEFRQRPAVPQLVRTTPDEFDAARAGASRRKHLLTGDDSGGAAMINMLSLLPGPGAAPHHQPTEEEFFFIGEGSLEMTCATETKVLGRSAFAFCPRNCTHGFRNVGDVESRFVTVNAPAGHERTMAEVRRRKIEGVPKEQLHALSVAGGFVFHSIDALG